ncbi:zinc-binding dehydrogenase [Sphingomonas canadensis]|uniref:Zinc-binding dehydrogenase n=1 Tax=Sphingomonas canadensis TaxID=1219257 RepID=A0ABW3H3R0_9SPHN|nr:zinc-binding dehydrogenase [Sphingomonas canadensis]MCW3835439.1 zinc-binding dehydrogenase [Sphingomonas canadensis]
METLEIRSTVTSGGQLVLTLDAVPLPALEADQILVRIEAAPVNPSDLGLLLGPADVDTIAAADGRVTATIPAARMPMMAARLDQAMPVGNEGAGVVIDAGTGARAMIGKTVALVGCSTYATHRIVRAHEAWVLPEGATPAQGASVFVNPLTALAMVETLRKEGHSALVHTAAASNLGQMLNRICIADGVPLVNIVRSAAQAAILRGIGAKHIVDSSAPDFAEALAAAVAETGATLAFDAVGGGPLANQILRAMEAAAQARMPAYSRYGSSTWKQVYIYGALDTGPTQLDRSYGLAWGVSGFLLTPFLMKAGAETIQRLRARVAAELNTTFASHYSAEISLREALDPDVIRAYARRATGEKYLINPAKG